MGLAAIKKKEIIINMTVDEKNYAYTGDNERARRLKLNGCRYLR